MRVTPENLRQVLDEIGAHRVLAIDTETTGLERTDLPFALIIAVESGTYYFDERVIPNFWSTPELGWILSHSCKCYVFQNAKFDMKMLARRGIHMRLGKIYDVAIMARLIKNDHFGKAYSLEAQAKRHGMEKLDEVKKYIAKEKLYEDRTTYLGETNRVPRYDRVPLEIMERYALNDARVTYDLYNIYLHQLDETDLRVFDNECRNTRVCLDMEEAGVYIDMDYTLAAREYEYGILAQAKLAFREAAGFDYVNSAKSLCPLFEKEGEKLHFTDMGNPSLTDDILESYTSPTARLVQSIRHVEKRISTYYDSYLNLASAQGTIHPTMWQAGTRTGRFSYSDPNLQNVPKEKGATVPYVVRGCIIPRPGHIFVSLDYSQMEYRMMLAYANEKRLIKQVLAGVDVHQATADLLKIERDYAKTLNFAILYGAGADKIAGMLGISRSQAMMLKARYFMGLPAVESFINKVIDTGRSRGWVANWLGRKLHADYEYCYALPNHLIQGGGADVVKVAMNRIDTEVSLGSSVGLVLQVHDQLLFEIKPEDLSKVAQIKEIMENVFPPLNDMRLSVDVSWSAKSFAERDMVKGIPDGPTALQSLSEIKR